MSSGRIRRWLDGSRAPCDGCAQPDGHVLYGSALTLAAAAQAWAAESDTPVRDLARAAVR
jgi:hypothetical protein